MAYGYEQRPDPPGRFVPSGTPPSRVSGPAGGEARQTAVATGRSNRGLTPGGEAVQQDPSRSLVNFRVVRQIAAGEDYPRGAVVYGWDARGAAVREVWASVEQLAHPVPEDPWADVKATVEPLDDEAAEIIVPYPPEGYYNYLHAETRDDDLTENWGWAYQKIVVPKVSVPALDDETGELAEEAISSFRQFAAAYRPFRWAANKAALDAVVGVDGERGFAFEEGTIWKWESGAWVADLETPVAAFAAVVIAGAIKAVHIDVATLSAITAVLGTVVSGLLQNAETDPTAAIRLDATSALPGTVTDYLDLAATGGAAFLKVGDVTLRLDGNHSWPDPVRNPARLYNGVCTTNEVAGPALEHVATWAHQFVPGVGYTVDAEFYVDGVFNADAAGIPVEDGTTGVVAASVTGGTYAHAVLRLKDGGGDEVATFTTRAPAIIL